MTKAQRIVVLCGVLALLAALCVPPWRCRVTARFYMWDWRLPEFTTEYIAYRPFWGLALGHATIQRNRMIPGGKHRHLAIVSVERHLDRDRLALECFIIVGIVGAILVLLPVTRRAGSGP